MNWQKACVYRNAGHMREQWMAAYTDMHKHVHDPVVNTDSPEQDWLVLYFLGFVFPPNVLVNL